MVADLAFVFCLFYCENFGAAFLFFFFQAEDGIRDLYVTGVQTCALPIWPLTLSISTSQRSGAWLTKPLTRVFLAQTWRSEERRVGKECRSRWSPYH